MVVCQGLVHVLISASQHLRMECVDLCLKEENGRCLFAQPVQSLPAGVLAKLDERLQKMEKLVIGALIKTCKPITINICTCIISFVERVIKEEREMSLSSWFENFRTFSYTIFLKSFAYPDETLLEK